MHQVSLPGLLTSSLLVVIAGIVSLVWGLHLERRLAVAAFRTVVQLLLVGQVLHYIFSTRRLEVLALVVMVMLGAASLAAVGRVERKLQGGWLLSFITLVAAGLSTTFTVTYFVLDLHPWYEPRYMIPLLGMILGNSLTGISLCLDSVLEDFSDGKELIEMELAHGANWFEAARGPLRKAVKRGMVPILNAMSVVGLVSLPGMMTGQILAGVDPLEAVKYQIVVMFMLAASTSVGSMLVAVLTCRTLFNERHQMLVDKIR